MAEAAYIVSYYNIRHRLRLPPKIGPQRPKSGRLQGARGTPSGSVNAKRSGSLKLPRRVPLVCVTAKVLPKHVLP